MKHPGRSVIKWALYGLTLTPMVVYQLGTFEDAAIYGIMILCFLQLDWVRA